MECSKNPFSAYKFTINQDCMRNLSPVIKNWFYSCWKFKMLNENFSTIHKVWYIDNIYNIDLLFMYIGIYNSMLQQLELISWHPRVWLHMFWQDFVDLMNILDVEFYACAPWSVEDFCSQNFCLFCSIRFC